MPEPTGPGPTVPSLTVPGVAADRDRRARLAVAAGYFVQGLCFAALLTQVPALKDKHGFDDLQLSGVLLAVPVIAGIGSLLAGVLAPRIGSALVLRVAGPAVCVAITAVGVAPGRPALYAALALFGLAVGAVDASMNMQAVSLQWRYGRSIIASFHAVWSLAGILGALATAAAGWLDLSLHSALGLVAVVGVALALPAGTLLLRPAETRVEPASPTEVATAAVVPWRPIVLIGLAVMLMYIADSATSNWSAVYLHDALDATTSVAALGYAAYQCAMVLGRAGADRAVQRYGAVRTVRDGVVLAVLGLLVVVVAPVPAVGIAGFAVLGLGLCVVVPQSFAAAGQLDPTGSGVAVARVNLFNYLGFVVGAPLVGVLAEVSSLQLAFAVPMVLVAGIAALAPAFRPAPR